MKGIVMNRRAFLAASAALVVAGAGYYFFGAGSTVNAGEIFTGKTPGVAINGYDVVAYHTQEKPVEGSKDHCYSWSGVDWHFSSAENRSLFAGNPQKYAPQYNGFCAFAVAHGQTAKTEPDSFSIVNGKLYLNYDQNIKKRWEGDKDNFIVAADKNWPELNKTN